MSGLQNIETFIEVAEQLSFAGAARALRLPPSTVTTRVRALEDSLGVRLLDRTTRSAALTPEGAVFLERCRAAMAEIDAARAEAGAAGSGGGTVRVSVPTALPKAQFAALVKSFLHRHPKISVAVSVDDRPVDFVRDGIDIALRGNRPGGDGLVARRLAQTPVVLAAPPGRLGDTALPVLGPLTRHGRGRIAPGQVHCDSFELARELVLAGIARACLPLPMCEADIARGSLGHGPVPPGVPETLALYAVYQDRRHLPERLRLFKDHLAAVFSDAG